MENKNHKSFKQKPILDKYRMKNKKTLKNKSILNKYRMENNIYDNNMKTINKPKKNFEDLFEDDPFPDYMKKTKSEKMMDKSEKNDQQI